MTQVAFIEKTGYSKTTIQEIEGGKKGVSSSNLAKLSDCLSVEPYELLVNPLNLDERAYAKFINLSASDRAKIRKLIDFMDQENSAPEDNFTPDGNDPDK